MNGARQSLALTTVIDRQIQRLAQKGALEELPPILTFQSLVDGTVRTRDILTRLYSRVPENGSELVLFDVNRAGVLEHFVAARHDALLEAVKMKPDRNFALTIVENESSQSHAVVAAPGPQAVMNSGDARWV